MGPIRGEEGQKGTIMWLQRSRPSKINAPTGREDQATKMVITLREKKSM